MNPQPDSGQAARSRRLRVLIIEDAEDDMLLILDVLRDAGFEPVCKRATSPAEMREALKGAAWDLVVSDYHLPEFNAMEALALYHEFSLDVPFLIVSGAIGEETAAAAMKAGAHDYVSKNNLARLAPAVNRELRDALGRKERADAEAALMAAHAELAAIQANVPVLLLLVDEDMRVHRANEPASCLAGIKPAEAIGRSAGHAIGCADHLGNPVGCGEGPACPPCKVRLSVIDTLANGTRHENIEASVPVTVGGQVKTRHLLLTSALLDAREPRKALVCAQDVTELKAIQLALEHANRELDSKVEQLAKALKEKDVLFREVQHRVKNNLAVISSLLSLQADQSDSEQAQTALAESRDRVRSLALIHDQLCWSGQMAEIEFGPYLERLTSHLLQCYVRDGQQIEVATALEAALPLDQAVPCALIVQELFSNSLKHAFRHRDRGRIRIEMHVGNGEYRLDYQDDGPGLPTGFDMEQSQSLGLRLVSDLAAQLRGEMKWPSAEGLRFQLIFPALPIKA